MNLKATLLTSAAVLVAMTAFASPTQAAVIGPIQPGSNPCDHMISPDPEVQAVINQCRQADDKVFQLANQIITLVINNVPGVDPDNLLPDFCSTQENAVPYALECAAWAINQVPPPPGSEQIVELVNSLIAEVQALAQWGQDYALVDLTGWYDATSAQASTDLGNIGTWVLAQEDYSGQVEAYANGVAAQAGTDAGREVTYAGATAGQAATDAGRDVTYAGAAAGQANADASALAAYINCRLFSPLPCGAVPMPHTPGVPPVPTVPGVPPSPTLPGLPPTTGTPPLPTVPSVPPAPHDPPL